MPITTTASKSWRDTFPIHPACELFPPISADELRTLGEDIRAKGLQNRIALWAADPNSKKFLLDGRNRLDAMELVGLDPCSCSQVTLYGNQGVDPHTYVISANIRRRHLTAEQKRELIAKLLQATPEKSDRQIAEQAKVDKNVVSRVRQKQVATGALAPVEKTVGKDGKSRKQPAKKQTVQATGKKPTAPVKQSDKPKREAPARDDTGSNSADEIRRLNAHIQELESQNHVQQSKIIGLKSEIEEVYHAHKIVDPYCAFRDAWERASAKDRERIKEFIANPPPDAERLLVDLKGLAQSRRNIAALGGGVMIKSTGSGGFKKPSLSKLGPIPEHWKETYQKAWDQLSPQDQETLAEWVSESNLLVLPPDDDGLEIPASLRRTAP